MSGGVFSAKTLKNNESKFHILQISKLKLFTQITLSIIDFALPDIDMSMVLLFLIEENNNFRYKAINCVTMIQTMYLKAIVSLMRILSI